MSKDIYVLAEQRDGKIQKVAFELIGEASKLAKELGEKVVGIILGSGITQEAQRLIHYGADEVVVVDDPILCEYTTEPYTKALVNIIEECKPNILLFGASSIGRDLAPRVAGRIHTGLTADCTKLEIDPESKLLLMTRPAFGGNIMATIVCKNFRPQMATVRPGVMSAIAKDTSRTGNVKKVNVAFDKDDNAVEILEVIRETRKAADITEAKVLVSGGRGIGGPKGFNILREIAEELGGEISSSRACVDSGWIEAERQVGQTGKTVRPDLYLACGISGAIQHVAGMEGSEYIIAINKNDTAAIFNAADLGVVGDVNAILPKLKEALAKYNLNKNMQ